MNKLWIILMIPITLHSASVNDIEQLVDRGDYLRARYLLREVNSFSANSDQFSVLASKIYYQLNALDSCLYWVSQTADYNQLPVEIKAVAHRQNPSYDCELASLMDGVELLEQRRYEEAQQILLNACEQLHQNRIYNLDDVVQYYYLISLLRSADSVQFINSGKEYVNNYQNYLSSDIAELMGQIYLQKENYQEALRFLKEIYPSDHVNYLLGKIYYQSGDYNSASFYFTPLLSKSNSYSDSAWNYLIRIGQADSLARARALSSRREYQSVINLLNQYLHDHPNSTEANYLLGRSYRKINNYPEALVYLQQAARGEWRCKALYNIGLCYQSLNRTQQEKQLWGTFISECNQGNLYDDGLYYLSKISLQQQDTADAVRHLQEILNSPHSNDMVAPAFNLLWNILDREEKLELVGDYLNRPLSDQIIPVIYSAAELCDPGTTEKIYKRIIEYDYWNEFSRRAENKLLDMGISPLPLPVDFSVSCEDLFSQYSIRDEVRLHCEKAKLLYAAGLRDIARSELAATSDLNPRERFLIAFTADRGLDRYRAISTAYGLKSYCPDKLPSDLFFILYPQAYRLIIEGYAHKYNLPVSVLQGLIRTESLFDHQIKSWAGATGLAQLMPSTAQGIAQTLGWINYSLTDPDHNIHMGAYYLSSQYSYFDRMEVAIAAYNAGPGNAARWKDNLGEEDFIDGITFMETRAYVPKVLSTARIYEKVDQGVYPR
ncbi:MAG: transglycosylase SLT domain-containing protein [bacterium]